MLYSTNHYALIVCCAASGLVPGISAIGLLFLIIKIILERFYFYRLFKEPIRRSEILAQGMLEEFFLAVKVMICLTVLGFWSATGDLKTFGIIPLGVCGIFLAIPFRWLLRSSKLTGVRAHKVFMKDETNDKMFNDWDWRLMIDYDRRNPWTKRVAKHRWLQKNKAKFMNDMHDTPSTKE